MAVPARSRIDHFRHGPGRACAGRCYPIIPAARRGAGCRSVDAGDRVLPFHAVEIVPDPARSIDALTLSPGVLAIAIASAAMAILCISLVGAFAGRRLDESSSFLAIVINNMTQGVILFDAHERTLVCNDRYIEMYGLSPDAAHGRRR